jgi:hypothetical protein
MPPRCELNRALNGSAFLAINAAREQFSRSQTAHLRKLAILRSKFVPGRMVVMVWRLAPLAN